MKFAKARYIPALLTVALLLGLSAETLSRPRPGDADPFHAQVRAAESNLLNPEGWTFTDADLPTGAITLLKPNVSLCRQYKTPSCQFQFLLIQCRDARDMGGHYPPVCYPSSGWLAVGDGKGKSMAWTIGSRSIVGMEYEFSHLEEGQTRTRTVDNLLIIPRGRDCYVCEMKEMREFAADYLRRFYGAAQIQFVFDGAVPENVRRETFTQLIGKNMDLLTALERSDEPRNPN